MNKAGQIIRELRQEAGYTQRSLAEALHVTVQAISKWERGICFPDVTLLPKLALLIDADVDLLVSSNLEREEWTGLISIPDCDFSLTVYDKPLVYFLLSHFLLLGIRDVHVVSNERNRVFLMSERFRQFGFHFSFEMPERKNVMVLSHPWFLFGSNLTRQFQGAMVSERSVGLAPENQKAVFFFLHKCDLDRYYSGEDQYLQKLPKRTLGRGMICFDMDDYDKVMDVAAFVRTYQKNAGMLIGSLEEIAFRRGVVTYTQLMETADHVPYGGILKQLAGEPTVV